MATNTHETFDRREEIKSSSDRAFGFVFTVVFALVAVWPWIFGTGGVRFWAAGVAAALLIVSFAYPRILAPANRLWMRFGLLLHRVMNPVVMGLIFFLTVTPTAVIFRLLGKDPLRLKLDRQAKTYWIDRTPPGPPPETMSQQF
jgi:hypothetical protein